MLSLLRTIGRGDLTNDDYDRLRSLINGEPSTRDPESFVVALATTGYVPLAYRHLVARARFPLAAPLATALGAEFRRHALSRFDMTRRLRELLAALKTGGVDAMPFKGAALAIQLYGNFAMRQFGDLDILVAPGQVGRALEVLKSEGLRPCDGYPTAWDAYIRAARHHDFSLRDSTTGILVELHWSLAAPLDGIHVDMDWFMRGRDTIDLIGARTEVMRAEQLLLALSIHGARHIWARLSWLGELAEIIRRYPSLDWDVVRREARRAGFTRPFAASVLLAHEWFGSPRPTWLRGDSATRRLVAIAQRPLSTVTRDNGLLSDRLKWAWYASPSMPSRLGRLWRIVSIPSEKDVATTLQSAWLSLFYVVPRGLRLLRTAFRDRAPRPRR